MKYESDILKRLINTYGVVGNPRYISEIIKEFIVRGKECFPNLFTYQADWLAHIDEFGLNPSYTVSYTGQSIYAPNTLERPVKRAILKGQTLVNIISTISTKNYKYSDYNISFIDKTKRYFIKYESTIPINEIGFIADNNTWNYVVNVNDLTDGYVIIKPNENKEIEKLRIRFNNADSINPSLNVVCIEYQTDMENWDIPYFTGMQSVKMPVLTTTGKNLFDFQNAQWLKGNNFNPTFGNTNNIVIENMSLKLSNPSSCIGTVVSGLKSNTDYYVSAKITNTSTMTIHTALGYVDNESTPGGVNRIRTTNSNGELAISIGVYNANTNGGYVLVENIQVEEGSVATSYEPYKTNILSTSEGIELRGIGDVQDTLDCLTGEVTQRVDEVVLNGSERWTYTGDHVSNEEYVVYHTNISTPISASNLGITNNLPYDREAISTTSFTKECIFINSVFQMCYIRIKRERGTIVDYLTSNPITVQYELEAPTIKTVDLTILDQNGQIVEQLMSFNGGTHFNTGSLEGSPLPSVSVSVETDLEEILMMCSLEGNTL